MKRTKETHKLDLKLHKSHLYNTFTPILVKISRTEQIYLHTPLIKTLEVHHVIVRQIQPFHHKIDILLILEIDTDDRTATLPQVNRSRYDNYRQDSRSHRSPYRSSYDSHIDEIHALDIDHVHTPGTDKFRSTFRHMDLLLYQETLDLLDLDHILKHEIK